MVQAQLLICVNMSFHIDLISKIMIVTSEVMNGR